ncbi:MAG TPA: FAD binding domain-containing protein [Acidimicrobiales bacterium]|nr:FAD binding domain-containing protein [Acidimicrobiales bacterium]
MPATVPEACQALTGDGALALGGGTAMGLLLRNGLVEPERLVWLGRIAALGGIAVGTDGSLRIGAATTLAELARHPEVLRRCASLARAASGAANPRIRAVATLGGHLGHADPRQDLPPVLLALGASAEVTGVGGTRLVEIADLLVGFMETSLAPDELITSVVVPERVGRRDVYLRYTPNSHDDYPTVGVAVDVSVAPDGRVMGARLALGGVAPTAVLVEGVADALVGRAASAADLEAVAEAARSSATPVDDQRGSAAYKQAMSGLWAVRAVRAALGGADER